MEKFRTDCVHYFICSPPNGPTTIGVCKLCGVKKEMRNSIEEGQWPLSSMEESRTPPANP
jgi:hypothetical protein